MKILIIACPYFYFFPLFWVSGWQIQFLYSGVLAEGCENPDSEGNDLGMRII